MWSLGPVSPSLCPSLLPALRACRPLSGADSSSPGNLPRSPLCRRSRRLPVGVGPCLHSQESGPEGCAQTPAQVSGPGPLARPSSVLRHRPHRSPAPVLPPLSRQTRWQAAGLAGTQGCLTLPPFGFLIAEKFIRSQTIASSKMPRENNQATLSPCQAPAAEWPVKWRQMVPRCPPWADD